MKKIKTIQLLPIVGGLLLIAAGVIFLLNNLGFFNIQWEIFIGPLFSLGGLVFLTVFIFDKEEWWALIPGFVLLGIGINIFMSQHFAGLATRWGGAVFLGFIGLAFMAIYISRHEHWWAIIPGGVLFTLAGVTLLPDDDFLTGGVFFLGLALTFGLVYLLPKPSGRLTWALYPAGILLLLGAAVSLGALQLLNYVWPAALLIAGSYVLYRALRQR